VWARRELRETDSDMNKNIEVALIGAGLMGHGLALVHAMGGHKVKMQDISNDPL